MLWEINKLVIKQTSVGRPVAEIKESKGENDRPVIIYLNKKKKLKLPTVISQKLNRPEAIEMIGKTKERRRISNIWKLCLDTFPLI